MPLFCGKINYRIFAIAFAKTVNIAQLVRALDCGSRGRGFESHYSPKNLAAKELAGFFYAF